MYGGGLRVTVDRTHLSGGIEDGITRRTFLLEDPREHGYPLFSRLVSGGSAGLSISRSHPDKLKRKYGISCPVFWLSQIEKEGCIAPASLSLMCHIIIEFIKNNPSPVIMLEGLEYLVTQTDFVTVLKHLHIINDYIKLYDAIFILPVEKATLDLREISILEREFGALERIK